MLLRKSIATMCTPRKTGATARSYRATRLGDGGEGQTTTSLPPSRERGRQKAGCRTGQTNVPSEGWQPTPLTHPPPLEHDNSAAPTRGEQDNKEREEAERRPPRSRPSTSTPHRAQRPGQPGGAAKTHRPRGQPRLAVAHRYDPDTDPWRGGCRARDPSSSSSNQPAVQQGDSSQQEAATLPRPSSEPDRNGGGQRATSHCLPATARADSTGQQPPPRASNSRR